MKEKVIKTNQTGMLSFILSFITAIVSLILVFLIAAIIGSFGKASAARVDAIAYICYDIVITIACFFICRHDPKSVWYAPIICNAVGIIAAIAEPTFWVTEMWIIFGGGWVLSLTGAISGAIIGRHTPKQL